MNQMNTKRLAPIAVACGAMIMWDDAFAYIDAGTCSLLIQWLFGMAVAGFAVLNIYWHRAKGFLSRKFANDRPDQDADRAAYEAERD